MIPLKGRLKTGEWNLRKCDRVEPYNAVLNLNDGKWMIIILPGENDKTVFNYFPANYPASPLWPAKD